MATDSLERTSPTISAGKDDQAGFDQVGQVWRVRGNDEAANRAEGRSCAILRSGTHVRTQIDPRADPEPGQEAR